MKAAWNLLLRPLLLSAAVVGLFAQTERASLPRILQKDGRLALLVDGAPYLILGAHVNNSGAWPAILPKVWPAIDYLHANTLEMPVYWEQFQPEPGRFDYATLETLLSQAREHRARLVCFGSAPGRMAVRITCRSG